MDPKELRACIDEFVLLEPQLQLVELARSWSHFDDLVVWMDREISKAILGEEADRVSYPESSAEHASRYLEYLHRIRNHERNKSMEHSHESCSRTNWPPENYELERFKLNAKVDGYYEFVLRRSVTMPTIGIPIIELLLLPRNPMRGPWCVARCASNLKWNIDCDCSNINAIMFAVQKASAFLRTLLEQSERVKLPEDCEWIYLDGLCVRDSRNGTVYPVPTDARRADILDAVVKEYRRTHPGE